MENSNKSLVDSSYIRWIVLGTISFIMAANYYFFDALSPIQSVIETKMKFSPADYGIVQSFYSFPNTFLVMCILGGIILDRWGIRKTGFFFLLCMLLGTSLMSFGVSDAFKDGNLIYNFFKSFLPGYSPELKVMSLGQLLFGLGAETSIVVISKIIVKWFRGKEIALAFGINLAIARLGSFSAYRISTRIIDIGYGWKMAIWFATFLILLSLIAFLIYMIFDIKYDRHQKSIGVLTEENEFHFGQLVDLIKNRSFIFIALLCLTFYSAVFPFTRFATDFFLNKFHGSLTASGDITSYLFIGTIIFTPVFGLLIDRFGRGATFMIAGSLLLVLVHLCFALTYITPYIPIIILGIAFSLVPAAMWPSVSRIVDIKKIGTAYGTMFSIQNLGLWSFPIIAGKIVTNTSKILIDNVLYKDYTYALLMFASLGIVGLFCAFLLKREDRVSGFGLEQPLKK